MTNVPNSRLFRPPIAALAAACFVVVAIVVAACGSGPDRSESDVRTPVEQPPSSVADTPAETDAPLPVAPVAVPSEDEAPANPPASTPDLAVGDSRPVRFGPAGARWQATSAAAFNRGNAVPRFYDVDRDEVWAVIGQSDQYYQTTFASDGDRLIAWTLSGADDETVLVDMASGTVTQILPFASELAAPWTDPEKIQLRVGARESISPSGADLLPGIYELDLGQQTLTFLSPTELRGLRDAVPSPSPWLPEATEVVVRPVDDGTYELALVNPETGAERVLRPAVTVWAREPRGTRLAVVTAQNKLIVYDFERALNPSLGVPAAWSFPRWAPDGRHLAITFQGFDGFESVIYDVSDIVMGDHPRIGPLERTVFADWSPDGRDALLLTRNCERNGFTLERIDLESGEKRLLDTPVRGFWNYRWSPRGATIAVAAPDLSLGLIDVESGAIVPTPALDDLERLQELQWSATGRWLKFSQEQGRDRCPG